MSSPKHPRTLRSRVAGLFQDARVRYKLRRYAVIASIAGILAWTGLSLVIGGVHIKAMEAVSQHALTMSAQAGLRVEQILIRGRENTDPAIIRGLLNTQKGDPLLSFDPHSARTLLERISWVRTAYVARRLPDTIYIRLEERTPTSLYKDGAQLMLIGRDGTLLTDHNLGRFRDMPVVSGPGAREAAAALLDYIMLEPEIMSRLKQARYIDRRRWDLVMRSGLVVNLPAEDIGLALRRLAQAQAREKFLDKGLERIDLRDPARMIVRTRPGTVREYKTGFHKADTSI